MVIHAHAVKVQVVVNLAVFQPQFLRSVGVQGKGVGLLAALRICGGVLQSVNVVLLIAVFALFVKVASAIGIQGIGSQCQLFRGVIVHLPTGGVVVVADMAFVRIGLRYPGKEDNSVFAIACVVPGAGHIEQRGHVAAVEHHIGGSLIAMFRILGVGITY